MPYENFKRILMQTFEGAKEEWETLNWTQKENIFHAMDADEDVDQNDEEYQWFHDAYWDEYRDRESCEERGFCPDCKEQVVTENVGFHDNPLYESYCKCA